MKSTQHSFGPCGLCYELGPSELCLSRDDSVNYSLFRSYGSAICKVLTAPNDEYMNIFENHTGATYNVDDSQDMSIANTIGRETIYLPIFYGSLLHLLFIRSDKKNRGKDPIELFKQHYEWEQEELGFVSAYPTLLALYQLVGKDGTGDKKQYRGKTRHLTKLDPQQIKHPNDLAKCAWNAAWDISFLSRLISYQNGEVTRILCGTAHPFPAVLISKDFNPAWLSYTTDPIGPALLPDRDSALPAVEPKSDFFDSYGTMPPDKRNATWAKILSAKKQRTKAPKSAEERTEMVLPCIERMEHDAGITPSRFDLLQDNNLAV